MVVLRFEEKFKSKASGVKRGETVGQSRRFVECDFGFWKNPATFDTKSTSGRANFFRCTVAVRVLRILVRVDETDPSSPSLAFRGERRARALCRGRIPCAASDCAEAV